MYSQPANTGVGVHESTQLVAAIDALKVRHTNSRKRTTHPVRMEDFALVHGLHALMDTKSNLFERFKQHPKVRYDEKTDLWSYKVRAAHLPSPTTKYTRRLTLLRFFGPSTTTLPL